MIVDTIAHGLWALAGGELLRRKGKLSRAGLVAGVALSVAPDVLQHLPLLGGVAHGDVPWSEFARFLVATPHESALEATRLGELSHHLHCMMHSVIVAGLVTLLAAWLRPAWLYPLLGWWSHILIDIPTHSADYYPVPIFYPFTTWGFDGIAWTTPWLLALNYLALALAGWALMRTRRRLG